MISLKFWLPLLYFYRVVFDAGEVVSVGVASLFAAAASLYKELKMKKSPGKGSGLVA